LKTIVAGSRSITGYAVVEKAIAFAIADGLIITQIVSGTAKGVDLLGERWAKEHKRVSIKRFPPDWSVGKSGGILRNIEMSENADAAIVVWDGMSRGSKHMYDTAKAKGLKVWLFNKCGELIKKS
jgi:hypothetical protein